MQITRKTRRRQWVKRSSLGSNMVNSALSFDLMSFNFNFLHAGKRRASFFNSFVYPFLKYSRTIVSVVVKGTDDVCSPPASKQTASIKKETETYFQTTYNGTKTRGKYHIPPTLLLQALSAHPGKVLSSLAQSVLICLQL